jgi:V/A-type H+/Na+-transporting ATPase subunit D
MADRLNISPTRGKLLKLKDDFKQVKNGHEMLDRKRRVLMRELFSLIAEAEEIEQKSRAQFQEAYHAINIARMALGVDRLRWISMAPSADITVNIGSKSIMGVKTALVKLDIEERLLPYSPGNTDVPLDKAHSEWLKVIHILGELVEKTVTVWRLATELRKTQRQVNALEEIIIPRYQRTIKYISDVLDENEREEIINAKLVKEHNQRQQEI